MSPRLDIMALSPPGFPSESVALAASRAGFRGVISFEHCEAAAAGDILEQAAASTIPFGLALSCWTPAWQQVCGRFSLRGLREVVLCDSTGADLASSVAALHDYGLKVFVQATAADDAVRAEECGADAVIVKGSDSGGRVGEETTFILLQRVIPCLSIPVWARGGIGLHSSAACVAAGAAGVVLDWQLALSREAELPPPVRERVARMDGSETAILGQDLGCRYRAYSRPGETAFLDLKALEDRFAANEVLDESSVRVWREAVETKIRADDAGASLLLFGQDAALAQHLAEQFGSVASICRAIGQSAVLHCRLADRDKALQPNGPLAASHGTKYPIVQGPMTRVSDTAGFAFAVAEGGGLPFLALALMRGPQVATLLEETKQKLGNRPWGVGILGFVPRELREEQLAEVRRHPPPYSIIAGGRPDQAAAMEREGIHTYLHIPSPALLTMFLEGGVRRVIFEGRECGGHVGPRTSFVLWDSMIRVILEHLRASRTKPEEYHVLFAGGVHDALSASMVAAMAAPLTERGVRIGVLMGTSYLFTKEAVETGAILPAFQTQAVRCGQTILLETGVGHATRCADTEFGRFFAAEKRRLIREGKSKDEIRDALERLNLGRLRIASKGIARADAGENGGPDPKYVRLDDQAQHHEGMFMIGQVAVLRDRVCSIAELHEEVSRGAERLSLFAAPPKPRAHDAPSDIALVGMSGMFPKAGSIDRFWHNLVNKVNAITEIPPDRWNWELYFNGDRAARDKVYSKWGGFLDDVPFDPTRYGIPPNTLPSIEPLQLLVLEAVRQAIQDAGYHDRPFNRQRASVILGAGGGVADLGLGYGFRALLPYFMTRAGGCWEDAAELIDKLNGGLPEWTEDSFAGLLMNVAAGRVANRFDLGGTNYTVDAACASSLAAVRLAVQELESGSSDMVIVGGADTMQSPFAYLCFSKTQALSPTGRCRTFDEQSDGIVISESIAVAVLKRLEDAERDGDRIYAVIKGVGSSSDGRDKGLTAPRPAGQVRALERAYQKAGIDPKTVGLIEAHGTGTVAGDQSEVESLTRAFTQAGAEVQSCALGSIKSLIGHTKCTAGLAGLLKAALALHHRVLPPTDGVQAPNPRANFAKSPFYVNSETRPWIARSDGAPRRAGVSAFGFGGTNFHAVLEEHCADGSPICDHTSGIQEWPAELFLWRAADGAGLVALLDPLIAALEGGSQPSLADLASAVCSDYGRRDGQHRLAIVAESLEDLRGKLASAAGTLRANRAELRDPKGIYYASVAANGKLALLFPGQGSQSVNMLRDLALAFPTVRQTFESIDRDLRGALGRPLSRFIFPHPKFTTEDREADELALTRTQIAQPAIGAADLAMLRLLNELGIHGDMTAGHSYGEYVALCAAGAITSNDLVRLSEARGRIIAQASQENPGAMAAVSADEQTVASAVASLPDVVIANVNSPLQTVIAGAQQAVDAAVRSLGERGIAARKIRVSCAFHSPRVAAAQAPFARALDAVPFSEPRISVYSNTSAAPHAAEPAAIRAQLVEHLVRPVRFSAEIEAMYAAGARVFIEAGPGKVLSGLVQRILGDRPHVAVNVDQPGRNGLLQLAHSLGQLAVAGVKFDPGALFESRVGRHVEPKRILEESKPAPPSPMTWLVNGARAVPLRDAGKAPTDSAKKTPKETNGKADAASRPASPTLAAPGGQRTSPVELHGHPEPPAPAALATAIVTKTDFASAGANHNGSPSLPAALHPSPNTDSVVTAYQSLMSKFLKTQKEVMLAYLRGATAPPQAAALQARIAPQDQPQPQISIANEPASAPSAQPAEISAAEIVPVMPAASNAAKVVEDAEGSRERLVSHLLKVVSERTGYPPEMLELDLDLEADLGIDSIKRIEILGSLQSAGIPGAASVEGDMEVLAKLKTLRAIVTWIMDKVGQGLPRDVAHAALDLTPAPCETAAVAVPRMVLRIQERPAAVVKTQSSLRGTILILHSEGARPAGLIDALRQRGLRAEAVSSATNNPANGSLRAHAPIAGLIYIAGSSPARANPCAAEGNLAADELVSFFELVKAFEPEIRGAGGGILVATRIDGAFGTIDPSTAATSHRGLAGMVKTLDREWPEVSCKVIDFERAASPETMHATIAAEFGVADGVSELGYIAGRRHVLTPTISEVEKNVARIELNQSSVILVTGGARGITAEVSLELACRFRPTLVLVGRSALPAPESSRTAGIDDPRDLKDRLRQQIEHDGDKAAPARIESAYNRLLQDREIGATLTRMREAGAIVEYHSADVADRAAFGALIEQMYIRHGRIDGVIHGAGATEDKLVRDKTVESFRRILAPKIDGADTLAAKLRPQSLKFLMFFSSVSARYGNRGQIDYAAANEVLNLLAQRLNRQWPGRVASLNWGPWESSGGMVSAELAKQFAKAGIVMISRPVGRQLFVNELLYGPKEDVEVVFGGPLTAEGTSPSEKAADVHELPLLATGTKRSQLPDGAVEVVRVLDPAYDLYLLDHQLDGKPVMPMAMSLELLAEIAASLDPAMHVTSVSDLRVLRGVRLDNGPLPLRVTAGPSSREGGRRRVVMRAEAGGDRAHLCYTAVVELRSEPGQATAPSRLVLDNPRPLGMTVEEAYERWLFHGPLFAGIVEVQALGDNGIIAKLAPSFPRRCLAHGNGSPWLIDPVVIDSGLQLLILWARTYLDVTPLPSRFECYHRFATPQGDLRCDVRIRSAGANPSIHADLMFYDASDTLVGWLEDMEVTCSKALNRLSEVRAGAGGGQP